MKQDECPHTWQAEAIDDARLSNADRAVFLRHLESCAECAAEWRELTQLREVMSHLSEASSSPFVRRRLRDKLVARVAKDGWSTPRAWQGSLIIGLAAAALLVGILVARGSSWRSKAPASQAVHFTVQDVHLAQWAQEQAGEMTRLRLASGSAAFQVQRVEPHQRFVLLLPDGEIEVHGTRFVVDVLDGHTMRVSVTEGVVSLRLQSQAEKVLHAGEGWTRSEPNADPTSSNAPPAEVIPEAESQPGVPNTSLPQAATTHAERRGRDGETPTNGSSPKPPASAPANDAHPAIDAFSAGVSAFEGGDYRSAERNFSRFLVEAPGDPRVEDASFLRALAHARMGDRQGAAQLAQKYLAQFPSGLRRKEAERLARDAKAPE
jgi:TolA-binding protein